MQAEIVYFQLNELCSNEGNTIGNDRFSDSKKNHYGIGGKYGN